MFTEAMLCRLTVWRVFIVRAVDINGSLRLVRSLHKDIISQHSRMDDVPGKVEPCPISRASVESTGTHRLQSHLGFGIGLTDLKMSVERFVGSSRVPLPIVYKETQHKKKSSNQRQTSRDGMHVLLPCLLISSSCLNL